MLSTSSGPVYAEYHISDTVHRGEAQVTGRGTSDWNAERALQLIDGSKLEPGALLPILHALQEEFGYIPEEAVSLVASALNLSRAEVYGVVSFYHDFRHAPPGRHVLKLCRAEACQSLGANALAAHLRRRLDVDWHGTTKDGALTLEPAFCLGLCAIGPAALLDGRPLARLDPARVDAELETTA
jgi:formate dehydrogenase subunit gamma